MGPLSWPPASCPGTDPTLCPQPWCLSLAAPSPALTLSLEMPLPAGRQPQGETSQEGLGRDPQAGTGQVRIGARTRHASCHLL